MKKEVKWLSTIWKVILGAHLVSLIFMSWGNVNIRFMMIIPLWIRYYLLIIVHANMVSKIGYKKSIGVTMTSLLLFMLYAIFRNYLTSLRYYSSIISQIKSAILESFYYYLIPSIIGLIIAIATPKNK